LRVSFSSLICSTSTTAIYSLSLHDRSSDLAAFCSTERLCHIVSLLVRLCRIVNWCAKQSATTETGNLHRKGHSAVAFFCHSCLRSEEHTSELQSRFDLVCRLLLDKKKLQVI